MAWVIDIVKGAVINGYVQTIVGHRIFINGILTWLLLGTVYRGMGQFRITDYKIIRFQDCKVLLWHSICRNEGSCTNQFLSHVFGLGN